MSIFTDALSQWNISLSDSQLDAFEKYYHLLVEWNEKINLTAITEYDVVYLKHFTDSLALVKYFETRSDFSFESINDYSFSLIDVGTGAGFPGIPLKILFPSSKIVLMDSLNKRINFLNEVIDELSLKDISAVHSRAEDLSRDLLYREKFDYCVSRAVANLSTLSEYCLPFVKVGGSFIPYKSESVSEELKNSKSAVFLLGGKINNTIDFVLPNSDINRSLVIIDKVNPTSNKYPRKAGLPSKNPL